MICSVLCTKETIDEFGVLKRSFDIFHKDTKWGMICDEETANYFDDVEIVKVVDRKELFKPDRSRWGHVFYSDTLSKYKLKTIEYMVKKYGETIHFDTDMVFFNKIDDDLIGSDFDAAYSPHYFFGKNHPVSSRVGYYNAGVVWVKSMDFYKYWEKLTDTGKYYFEQKPLEIIYDEDKFNIKELPKTYNYACGNQDKGKIKLDDDGFMVSGNSPLVNVHVHLYKQNIHLGPDSTKMKEVIKVLLKESNNEKYGEIRNIIKKHDKNNIFDF